DPQALNDFLHGSDQLDGDDLLDTAADPASAFFTDASLNVQDTMVNHLNSGQTQNSSSAVDLDFLEDDILGPSPGSNLQNSDQPCDILQQSLQEANITEQSLEEDADLDIASLHFPSLQPVSQAGDASQLFSASADLIGLQQQPTVLAQQTLIQQQTIGGQVVNKAINVQPFLQQVGLGNVTLQPVSNLQGLPNGSPSGALGIGQIQVVGQLSNQSVMTINQPAQQIITKAGQPTQVTTVPVGSYISSPASDQQQVALNSAGVSPPNTGLVLQKNAAPGALNGNSLFAGTSIAQANQSLTVRPTMSSPMMQAPLSAQNVIIQRTPTPIQPKPTGGVIQHKLFQISSKPFASANTALAIQNETTLQQQQQQNVTFMAGKPVQNVVFSASGAAFPQTISSSVFKQHQAQQQALGKSLSLHLQGGSIVIQPQHMQQAMLQSQSQFLLQGQLSGASAVPLSQQLSALQANVGGQILTAQSAGGQAPATHIIASQGPAGQLIANQTLPAQILTNQNIAGQLDLSQVIAAQNAHGATHILSAPIQLQPGSVGQPAVFQMPVSLANSLNPQTSASVQATLAGGAINQQSQSAVIQGVTLPNQVTMLNSGEGLGQAVSIQQPASNAQGSSVIQQQVGPSPSLMALGNGQPSLLTVQTAAAAAPQSQPPQQHPVQQQLPSAPQPGSSMGPTPGKIIIGQQGPLAAISQDAADMFFQQQEQKQQQLYQAALKLQQEKGLNQSSPHSLAPTSTTSSVPASVIVSSSTKPGVIGSISGLNMNLTKGPIQIQLLGKGLTQLMPAASIQAHQMDNKLGGLKVPVSLKPTKEAVVLDSLHKHQDAVLHPDYTSCFRSHDDMVHRLLPYHLYQGTLPSGEEHSKVDEEFEAVSTQLLKRTQAMLNKYRMLLFEEARRLSPSAEMVMIDRMFIQEEKTSLTTDKQLAKEKPDEYVASSSRSHSLATSSPSPSCNTAALLETPRIPSTQTATQIHPTKLVIKHSGGSPSVSWARDGDDETLHTRSRPPPMKTYEARSRIGLKLKIKQEAGLSKVVHNTALDPVHQSVTTSSVIKSTECPMVTSDGQMNGTLDHAAPSPAGNKPPRSANYCKLPPRKTYRDNVQSLSADRTAGNPSQGGPVREEDSRRETAPKCEETSKSVIATCKSVESPKVRTGRGRAGESAKGSNLTRKTRTHTDLLPPKSEEPPGGRADDGAGGLMKELSDVEDELTRGVIKADPPDGSWELALPPAKRSKSESFDMDNASFSSDSPQDDTLNEHLQSAIDSILNLRQPQSVSVAPTPVSNLYNSSENNSSPFPPTPHSDSYLAPNHNGGLGTRTYTR
ncbi:hypothetical protein scyTo_0018780, partial [Scyliorhinus torazame]|nr:hypothetical protein [Scyliorhinus torazame]